MEGLPSYINKANMCWNAEFIAWTEKLWHELLNGKLPKVICLSSYLCPFNLGLIRIAKNYNIKVIEQLMGNKVCLILFIRIGGKMLQKIII